jgi:hypothetical protein
MMKKRCKIALANLQTINSRSSRGTHTLVNVIHAIVKFFRLNSFSKYLRYLELIYFPFNRYESKAQIGPPIEVLFVTTQKDFQVLRHAISFAIEATTAHTKVNIVIIVPDHEVDLCSSTLQDFPCLISIIPESHFIDESMRLTIRARFKNRAGWVIQQILKDLYVLSSKSLGVLIIDSDTLLIEKRLWVDDSGHQILLPTWEYHLPYYRFLAKRGICNDWPKYTFVSHHMLMQPRILREAFVSAGWKSKEDLLESLVSQSEVEEQSPFCIEYELYGQFIYSNYPHLVKLEKWSNIGRSRDEVNFERIAILVEREYRGKYASLSLHSYL